jgi:tyrosine-protein phosphatase SIW14
VAPTSRVMPVNKSNCGGAPLRLNRTAARFSVVALALSFTLAAYPSLALASERAAPGAAAVASAPVPHVQIENFGRVNPNYYRGAQPRGRDFADLAAAGVKMVIDLAEEGDPAEEANAKKAGMRFTRIPMTTHESPGPVTIARFLALVNDPANQPVYVHCMGGRHRTGVMTAIYRVTGEGWTPLQAFNEMKQYKYGADFLHQEFKDFILGFTTPGAPAPAARDNQ